MYRFIVEIFRIYLHVWFKYQVKDRPEIPKDQRLIVCANHQSIRDVFALACAYPGKLHFVGKEELGRNKLLNWVFRKLGVVFIDREAYDIDAIRKILANLKEDKQIGIFPEGTRVKEINPQNMKSGVGLLAIRGKSDVLVASIISEYKFRKPLIVQFHPIISYEPYEEIGSREGRKELSKDIFNTIYSTNYDISDFSD